MTLAAGGRSFSAWEELRATRRSAAQQRRKVRRKAWQQQQRRAAVAVRGTGLRRGGGDGGGGVCGGGVCSRVCADRQTDSSVCVSMCTRERQRAQRAAGKAACSSGGGQRGRETERLKHRERAAAGTLRFGWLNTIQSSSHPNPQPAHKPVRDVSQIGALLQPLFWQVSHRACHLVSMMYDVSTA